MEGRVRRRKQVMDDRKEIAENSMERGSTR
jgi:hypothetical protein